ncbi:hypothetical protein [Paraburkholderia sp. C35]|uniref:hypothetical protein n=1 Tax=Paraburkholderia sp. C35 TaxID=2126993 RepID=UPI0013A56EED|nr:hypothetical protein [Paraburkholderia sp. C35]
MLPLVMLCPPQPDSMTAHDIMRKSRFNAVSLFSFSVALRDDGHAPQKNDHSGKARTSKTANALKAACIVR